MKRVLFFLLLLVILGILWTQRVHIQDAMYEVSRSALPEPVPYVAPIIEEVVSESEPQLAPATEEPVPVFEKGINLAVPFTSQAPHAHWDEVHEETCEEAAALMVDAFFDVRALTPDAVEVELRELIQWEMERFGYFKDTTAEETALILQDFYGYDTVEVSYEVSEEAIREVLRQHLPVIVPSYGRALGNPNFRGDGPLYHMLVIRGYTEDGRFITNDPGTRNGEEYVYDSGVLLNAIHDWNDGNVEEGRKAMIVVKP